MRRLIPLAGLGALALFPAAALARPTRAQVLSVSPRHRTVQLVDAAHVVHAYRYRGRVPRLGLGDTVTYRRTGRSISHLKKLARASQRISFYATVVRSGSRQVRLRLGDGTPYRLNSGQVASGRVAHAAASTAPITVEVNGLAAGETVLISETVDAAGHWTITITLPSSGGGDGSTSGEDPSGDEQVAEGTITQLSGSELAVNTDAGPLAFSVDPASDVNDGLLIGDAVDVTYLRNADGTLTAEDVEYVEQDTTGLVTAVSDTTLTVTDETSRQAVTVTADPTLGLFTDVAVGDAVDVTYHQSSTGLVADAVDDQAWDN